MQGNYPVLLDKPGVSDPAPAAFSVAAISVTVVSVLLHVGALAWWLLRPVQEVQPLAEPQVVAVELLSMAPPEPDPVVVPPPPEPPVPEPEPEVLQDEEMAVEHKVIRKKPPEKKQPVKPQPPPVEPVAAAPVPKPAAAPPAPVMTPARHDVDYLKNPPPQYPSMSRRLSEEGRVLLRVQVSATGDVLAVEMKKSSGFARLDEAARKAVAKWRFTPAKQGNTALVSWVEVPIQFSLQK